MTILTVHHVLYRYNHDHGVHVSVLWCTGAHGAHVSYSKELIFNKPLVVRLDLRSLCVTASQTTKEFRDNGYNSNILLLLIFF